MGDSGKIKKHYHFQYLKYETMMKCSFEPSLDLDRLNILSSGHLTFSNCILILYFGKCFFIEYTFVLRKINWIFNHALQREHACFFYISHYSVTKLILSTFTPSRKTRQKSIIQVNWYFSFAVVSSWKGISFIYVCFSTIYRENHRAKD